MTDAPAPTRLREPADRANRLPPVNAEAEQALLGTILCRNDTIDVVRGFLRPEHFGWAAHQRIFEAILRLVDDGQNANPVTLKHLFADDEELLVHGGGGKYRAQLAASPPTLINAESYARAIADLAERRAIMAIGRDLAEAGDPNRDRGEIVARAKGQLDEIGRAKDSGPAVEIMNGASIVPRSVAWLWQGWLAQGKYHILAGAAGTGKTTIAIELAAVVTTGGRWPDGTAAPIADVLMWSGEDDMADSLVPRLLASGGNPSRFHFIGGMTEGGKRRPFDPSRDIPALTETARQLLSLRMLILDPVVSAVLGDSHKNAETRRALQPLVDFAAEVGCAVLGITHFTKSTAGRDPVDRVTGSLAFGTVPRLVMATAKVNTGGKRRLVRAKSNIGLDGGGFEYDLIQEPLLGFDFGAQRVAWGRRIEGTARQLLNEVEQSEGSSGESVQSKAEAFLRETLADGAMAVAHLKSAAEAKSLAWRTVERAKRSLRDGIIAFKQDMKTGWHWRLSETELTRRPPGSPEDRHQNGLAAFGEDGGLQGWEEEI